MQTKTKQTNKQKWIKSDNEAKQNHFDYDNLQFLRFVFLHIIICMSEFDLNQKRIKTKKQTNMYRMILFCCCCFDYTLRILHSFIHSFIHSFVRIVNFSINPFVKGKKAEFDR